MITVKIIIIFFREFMGKSRYIVQPVPSYAGSLRTQKRNVPLRIVLSVIFNNIYGYIGLSFAGIGLIFAALFTPVIDFVSPFHFGSDALTVQGAITEAERTNVSLNEENVIKYRYTFEYMGRSYTGISYSTDNNYRNGQRVNVEFEPDNPQISRIEGMSVKPAGLWMLFIYIFPGVGFLFLFFAFKKGLSKIGTIRYGIITRGKFINKESTGGSINGQTIYDLFFTFTDMSGNVHTATGSTHKIEAVMDEPEERIIYDPSNPSGAVVVDAMPVSVRKFLESVPG